MEAAIYGGGVSKDSPYMYRNGNSSDCSNIQNCGSSSAGEDDESVFSNTPQSQLSKQLTLFKRQKSCREGSLIQPKL